MLMPPDAYPRHDPQWLSGADIYESLTEQVVLNPRNLQPRSLEDIDFDWLQSRALWHKWLKYERDFDKRPDDMR
jgi:hypothetical protein